MSFIIAYIQCHVNIGHVSDYYAVIAARFMSSLVKKCESDSNYKLTADSRGVIK